MYYSSLSRNHIVNKQSRSKVFKLFRTINQIIFPSPAMLPLHQNKNHQKMQESLDIQNICQDDCGQNFLQKSLDQVPHAINQQMKEQYFKQTKYLNGQIVQDYQHFLDNEEDFSMYIVSPLTDRFDIYSKKAYNEYEVTKYNQNQADIFDEMVSQVKMEENLLKEIKISEDQYQHLQEFQCNDQVQNSSIINQSLFKQQSQSEYNNNVSDAQQEDSDQQYSVRFSTFNLLKKSHELPLSNKSSFTKFNQNKNHKKRRQSKYRHYSQEEKLQAISLAFENGLQFAHRYLEIPKKNISRWMRQKPKLKIRGRKPGNPEMQEELTNWINLNIQQENYLTQSEIRQKALQLSDKQCFKASKGWLEKYFRRNTQLSQKLSSLLIKRRCSSQVNVQDKKMQIFLNDRKQQQKKIMIGNKMIKIIKIEN